MVPSSRATAVTSDGHSRGGGGGGGGGAELEDEELVDGELDELELLVGGGELDELELLGAGVDELEDDVGGGLDELEDDVGGGVDVVVALHEAIPPFSPSMSRPWSP
jgi:hypothetical protein